VLGPDTAIDIAVIDEIHTRAKIGQLLARFRRHGGFGLVGIVGVQFRLMVQVDTLCHKIPNFIEKAARAGTNRVLVGLESINAANLLAAKKRHNKITEYRAMLLAWKNAGATTTAGYILGFPFSSGRA
jgi:hypothetical protein